MRRLTRRGGRWGSCRDWAKCKRENRRWKCGKRYWLRASLRKKKELTQRVEGRAKGHGVEMTVVEKNFWLTTVAAPVVPVRDLPERVDVAVIGAGFTGLSAARTLARGGARVAVLEAENVGWGASCRNGGMVL